MKSELLPVIPVVAAFALAPYHGTAVVGFVASGTNPDLVSPFISNLG